MHFMWLSIDLSYHLLKQHATPYPVLTQISLSVFESHIHFPYKAVLRSLSTDIFKLGE